MALPQRTQKRAPANTCVRHFGQTVKFEAMFPFGVARSHASTADGISSLVVRRGFF
jgi:hypothetical protein